MAADPMETHGFISVGSLLAAHRRFRCLYGRESSVFRGLRFPGTKSEPICGWADASGERSLVGTVARVLVDIIHFCFRNI